MNSIKRENNMATKVNTYRTTAKVVGTLYIFGFVVGIAGSVLGTPGQLEAVSARSMMIAIGALLWAITAAGDAAHGVMMFPILKQNNERIVLGYFATRIGADLLQVPIIEKILAPCWNCGGMVAKHPDKADADSCWPPKISGESACCCVKEIKKSNNGITALSSKGHHSYSTR